ncbi:MAG: DUF2332 domain-containing protein [Pseudomonadota bacterium]
MTLSAPLVRALRWQAEGCRKLGSPFGGLLLDLAADGAFGDIAPFFERWRDADLEAHVRDATPLRFMGALHHLVLTGAEPGLAAQFPAARPLADEASLAAAARETLIRRRDHVLAFMASPPQTNEVGRSFALAPGFMVVAAATGLPLALREIGSSAGLNLRFDRYRYDFGGRPWGEDDSPVLIANDWRGAPPPLRPLTVIDRAGCDQAPVDVRDEAQAMRLQAYVWADQPARLGRLRGAIAVARDTPAELVRADAAAWTASHLSPRPGVASVLFHSVMWQYMPPATQAAVRSAIETAGAAARADSPVAWLRMEPDPASADLPMELRLTLWPPGGEQRLATVHPHGAWVNWR